MTREEAIRFANYAQDMAKTQDVKEFYALAAAALRKQEERRWVPVTKRFPNTGAVVLTFSNKDGVNIGKYVGYGAFAVRKWDINSKPSRTTHWMPLPEPPKGE